MKGEAIKYTEKFYMESLHVHIFQQKENLTRFIEGTVIKNREGNTLIFEYPCLPFPSPHLLKPKDVYSFSIDAVCNCFYHLDFSSISSEK